MKFLRTPFLQNTSGRMLLSPAKLRVVLQNGYSQMICKIYSKITATEPVFQIIMDFTTGVFLKYFQNLSEQLFTEQPQETPSISCLGFCLQYNLKKDRISLIADLFDFDFVN